MSAHDRSAEGPPESLRRGRMHTIRYRRSRFSTRLPTDRYYTPAHYWLMERSPGVWEVGLTGFAIRMLGELVEHDFEVSPGDAVEIGQIVGWVEAFKAVSDLYAVASGTFEEANGAIAEDPEILKADPYQRGWLYRVRGEPDTRAVDVHGYTAFLDTTIDKMRGQYE